VRPDAEGRFVDVPTSEDLFVNLQWDETPVWPNLSCVLDATLTPFLSKWHQFPRIHHLLSLQFNLASHWQDPRDRTEAAEWFVKQLAFDFREHTSLWGSIHLIAPNPVFRDFQYTRGKSTRADFETVAYKVDFRAGKRPHDLMLIVRDDTPSGTGLVKAIPLTSAYGTFLINREFSLQSIYVTDRWRGLLYGLEGFYFFGGFSITMQMVTARRVVRDEQGEPLFTVPVVQGEGTVAEGDAPGSGRPKPQHAAAILRSERSLHRQRRKAHEKYERWFQGDKEAALKLIHKLILTARERVLIVDPYFGVSELRFALGIAQLNVPIRILTSAEVLSEIVTDECPPTLKKIRSILNILEIQREKIVLIARTTHNITAALSKAIGNQVKQIGNNLLGNASAMHGDQLLSAIQAIKNANPLEIKVMTGSKPEVHDRFLLVDDSLWLLGSSLNEFGARGTMIAPIIYPALIESRLDDNWERATSLEDWLKGRHEKRQAFML